jgi:beta-N-acetylhexosaminidase
MKNTIHKILFTSLILLFVGCSLFQNKKTETKEKVILTENKKANKPFIKKPVAVSKVPEIAPPIKDVVLAKETLISEGSEKWVDSIYNKMSFDEKVGQLFMVAAYSGKDEEHFSAVDKLIDENKIGGLIFFKGTPIKQAKLTNRFQSKSKVPLFIGIDAEWGLSMRLDSTTRYPWNMTLGAIQDRELIEKMGRQLGYQTKRLGCQFNFAPVIDINTNPKNPVIGFRSFGENKEKVTDYAASLMKGMHQSGIFSTGKHFPGHGDSSTDSHHTLPTISFSKERMEDIEFYPYKKLFNEGMSSVMVAHLNVPSLELRKNFPTSISYNVVTNILQKELGFNGLIFTDALNMKGASDFMKPGEIDLEAFLAGNDILLFPENVPYAFDKICIAYQDGIISEERLAQSVKKILNYKYLAGFKNFKQIDIKNLYNDINKPDNEALKYQLYENAITVLKNDNAVLPIKNIEKKRIAYVKIGEDETGIFLKTLKKYSEITEVFDANVDSLNLKLKNFNQVIIGYHKPDKAWKVQEISDREVNWINEISKNNNVILASFTKPYLLSELKNITDIEGIVLTYQSGPVAQEVAAELFFGAFEAKGKLPVSITPYFKENDGLSTEKLNVLGFANPINVGMDPDVLNKIDAIVQKAISKKMTPGAQVLVARKGKVVFHKSYGYQTYENNIKVSNSDIYDIASLTKIIATLPNVMQDFDSNKINLNTSLVEMLPLFANTDKATINFQDLLSHQAGLQAWIPFYQTTLDKYKQPDLKYYKRTLDTNFSIKVADSLYLRNDYRDTIIKRIIDSKLSPKKEYKYSDFTFIILKEYLEKTRNKSLDIISDESFFKPLGMTNTFYNPLNKIGKSFIVPTENDNYFRYQILQGNVHDMAAAMQGGVAGHAGLFSSALDIAKMMQMYLQKGNYGGVQYFSENTFNTFNSCHFCANGNRRGLGFDKTQLGEEGPTCNCVSKLSFGHTGFTGTMTWADPQTETVYVFLSNRTYPDANLPNALSKENIREDIQKIIQEAIIK